VDGFRKKLCDGQGASLFKKFACAAAAAAADVDVVCLFSPDPSNVDDELEFLN